MVFPDSSKPSHYLYGQYKCKSHVNYEETKTSGVDKVAPSVLLSGFMLDQSKSFDSELGALLFSQYIKLYLGRKYKRDTY